MGEKGRLKVENKFNISNVVDQMESLYIKLLSGDLKIESLSK
jgi:hypothetical protein